MSPVDVLIIAALPEEYAAARSATNGVGAGQWREHDADGRAPYLSGEYKTPAGNRITAALARPTGMGGRRTHSIATTLTDLLRPTCLAMCGVCAGNPETTAPGDVVVAAPAYEYDEGKVTAAGFQGAHQQYPLNDRWLRAAQDFDPATLPSHGVATEPDRLPFAVKAGPMASGSAVIQDPRIWATLARLGVRTILALEMEAATIATVAHEREVPHWLVAKGVMDNANFAKDDRFKHFAARASAEVLFALLGEVLPTVPGARIPPPPTAGFPGSVKLDFVQRLSVDWPDLADKVGVPVFARARFGRGDEPRALWEWLEVRGRLADLPAALTDIGRADLGDRIRPYV